MILKYLSGTVTTGITPRFTVPANGVRGVDGAGIDQYGPAADIYQDITINGSLTDSAQANISLAAASPIVSSVPVLDTTNGQYLQLPVLVFNVNAQNDTLHLHQVVVNFVGTASGNTATATAAYLYNGSTPVASASIIGGVATFANITDGTNGASIPVGTTVAYTVKADVTGVTAGSLTVTASIPSGATGTMIYNTQDSSVTNSGSAAGQTQTVLGKGPSVTLSSATITKDLGPSGVANATSTLTGTFNVNVQAIGSDITFGTQASTTNVSGVAAVANAGPMFVFGIYKDGLLVAENVASTSNFSIPTGTTQTGQNFVVSQNQTVSIPVTFSFQGRSPTTGALDFGSYAIGLERVQYWTGSAYANISTSGQTQWRTGTQVLP